MTTSPTAPGRTIWVWAGAYFACYVPYGALTKGMSARGVAGMVLLPSTLLAGVVTTAVFLALTGWWRQATRRRVGPWEVPVPTATTMMSGACSTAILVSTTLAYTIEGASILAMMLAMRGGVLALGPIVDALSGRKIRTASWVALGLSFVALTVTLSGGSLRFTALALIDLTIYLGAYFLRLRLMSRRAKSGDPAVNTRFFVEEQLVAAPLALALLALGALLPGTLGEQICTGWSTFLFSPMGLLGLLVGVLSQGTGIFGGLVLLDARENSFCIPVNRASSVLAGVSAATLLWLLAGGAPPTVPELVGAAMMIGALVVLSLPSPGPVGSGVVPGPVEAAVGVVVGEERPRRGRAGP